MTGALQHSTLLADIQHNCDISDARDHGVYSMCTMVLKLRNLYKWETNMQPWDEPDPGDLLDWIEVKETYWEGLVEKNYRTLVLPGTDCSPFDCDAVNNGLDDEKLFYGSGYGRSLKAVFFLAEQIEKRTVEGCPVVILGREVAKEMASPFAMAQDGRIIIRRESLRYFLWDQIQELRSSCKSSMQSFLLTSKVLRNGSLDQQLLKDRLDTIVDEQMDLFIYHEVGELLQTTMDSGTLQSLTARFPGSIIEFVCRALKDTLADTHPQGLLSKCIREQRESSLALYIGLLDGLRLELMPEMALAWKGFLDRKDWSEIENARNKCRSRNLKMAETVQRISHSQENLSDGEVQAQFHNQVTLPLGLDG